MTTPIGTDEEAIHNAYSRAQTSLQAHKDAMPEHDPRGIDDPAISKAAREHAQKTKDAIDGTSEQLDKGKQAASGLANQDKDSAAKVRNINGPGGLSALKNAMSKPLGSANPFMAPAAAPMAAPMPSAPPSMPAMMPPQMPLGQMVNIPTDALNKLVENANFTGNATAASAAAGGVGGGKAPLNVRDIDFTRPAQKILTKPELLAVINKALDNNGVPRDPQIRRVWEELLYNQARKESSGENDAANGWDINAHGPKQIDGFPLNSSRGILQVIPETFARYHIGGTSNNIYDLEANSSASVAYMMAKFNISADGSGLAQAAAQRRAAGYGGY